MGESGEKWVSEIKARWAANQSAAKSRPIESDWRVRVAKATVRLPKGGLGVLVPGGFVLTAAHCITWDGDGAMVLGDRFIELIAVPGATDYEHEVTPDQWAETAAAHGRFALDVEAAEPKSDIAVLRATDVDELYGNRNAFEEWCENTEPVRVSSRVLAVDESLRVHVLTHKGEWVTATVARYGFPGSLPGSHMCIVADGLIPSGTSGGPIVDGDGQLVGVVSHFGGPAAIVDGQHVDNGGTDGTLPIMCLALPRWVWAQIEAAQRDSP